MELLELIHNTHLICSNTVFVELNLPPTEYYLS